MIPDLENCHLDHIAVATKDLEETVKIYQKMGLKFSTQREVVPEQKVKTAFAAIDDNAHLELLEPTDKSSAIQKFIDKKGPGIHHLCFRVSDVTVKQAELEQEGFQFIYPEPVRGANNCLVNFIHPKSMHGVLTELSQKL